MKQSLRVTNGEFKISGYETVRPTPDILDALEKDYPLEASVADLVDNSIDARARRVLVRFIKHGDSLASLCVVDDGRGMDSGAIRRAMQFAARRAYTPKDLGMFGVGLKTASLSQADVLTVMSRSRGNSAVGRQWTKTGIKTHDWRLNVLTAKSSNAALSRPWGPLGRLRAGTVVRWDRVYDFDRLRVDVGGYLERAILRIHRHLGLKLHRFIESGRIRVFIDVEDVESAESGPLQEIQPTNPFPPPGISGARGFPKDFTARIPSSGALTLRAHIWRKRSSDEGYKLGGGKVAEHQGFYFYRHDRLIQDGGWCELIGTSEPHLSLARVEVDIPDGMAGYLRVHSNKAGVDAPASFADAVLKATAGDGSDFGTYLVVAEEVYRRREAPKPRPMLKPGDGIPANVLTALEGCSTPFLRGRPCSVAWCQLSGPGFLEVDHRHRQIRLNNRYRKMLLRGAHGGGTDLPLLRTVLYLALESLLAGERIGPIERARLKAIQAAMNAGLKLEQIWAEK